ncbi:D-alanine-D-alanine ligase [Pelagirhabdus alkalitolerans]|uniref:D-alanine-D-alanine ligase n=2 Tax=Pelagirhabdus alkalitolerans TaxID=1612202 RepID=A0A1G6GGT7_9BACI|nr:D-alanine-D-alanine ligase [Pelagirhabdus alkalitolerans]
MLLNMNEKWLDHLINAVPSEGMDKYFSIYAIALEGWRRGLELTIYRDDKNDNKFKVRYSLSDGKKTYHFDGSGSDLISSEAYHICDDKFLTKERLKQSGLPVTEGKKFSVMSKTSDIINYAKTLGFPLVLKPTDGKGGSGVFSNIKNMDEFKSSLNILREQMNFKNIMVESYATGEEHRVFVVGDQVEGVMKRVAANVVGDGDSTIRELINQKNKIRLKNPHLRNKVIKADQIVERNLNKLGLNLESVPLKNEFIQLRLTSNLSTGGDSVEIKENVSEELHNIAIKATKAIPGLFMSGMDIIVDEETSGYYILEANTKPGLGGHMFPAYGVPKDLAKSIVDYHFPATKGKDRSLLYFDFDGAVDLLKRRTAKKVVLSHPSKHFSENKQFSVEGELNEISLKLSLGQVANEYNINGYLNMTETRPILHVNGENVKDIKKFVDRLKKNNPNIKLNEESIKTIEPIEIGFKILTNDQSQNSKKIEKEIAHIERERAYYEQKYVQVLQSRSWKLTKIIRSPLDIIKMKFNQLFKK